MLTRKGILLMLIYQSIGPKHVYIPIPIPIPLSENKEFVSSDLKANLLGQKSDNKNNLQVNTLGYDDTAFAREYRKSVDMSNHVSILVKKIFPNGDLVLKNGMCLILDILTSNNSSKDTLLDGWYHEVGTFHNLYKIENGFIEKQRMDVNSSNPKVFLIKLGFTVWLTAWLTATYLLVSNYQFIKEFLSSYFDELRSVPKHFHEIGSYAAASGLSLWESKEMPKPQDYFSYNNIPSKKSALNRAKKIQKKHIDFQQVEHYDSRMAISLEVNEGCLPVERYRGMYNVTLPSYFVSDFLIFLKDSYNLCCNSKDLMNLYKIMYEKLLPFSSMNSTDVDELSEDIYNLYGTTIATINRGNYTDSITIPKSGEVKITDQFFTLPPSDNTKIPEHIATYETGMYDLVDCALKIENNNTDSWLVNVSDEHSLQISCDAIHELLSKTDSMIESWKTTQAPTTTATSSSTSTTSSTTSTTITPPTTSTTTSTSTTSSTTSTTTSSSTSTSTTSSTTTSTTATSTTTTTKRPAFNIIGKWMNLTKLYLRLMQTAGVDINIGCTPGGYISNGLENYWYERSKTPLPSFNILRLLWRNIVMPAGVNRVIYDGVLDINTPVDQIPTETAQEDFIMNPVEIYNTLVYLGGMPLVRNRTMVEKLLKTGTVTGAAARALFPSAGRPLSNNPGVIPPLHFISRGYYNLDFPFEFENCSFAPKHNFTYPALNSSDIFTEYYDIRDGKVYNIPGRSQRLRDGIDQSWIETGAYLWCENSFMPWHGYLEGYNVSAFINILDPSADKNGFITRAFIDITEPLINEFADFTPPVLYQNCEHSTSKQNFSSIECGTRCKQLNCGENYWFNGTGYYGDGDPFIAWLYKNAPLVWTVDTPYPAN